VAIRPEFRWWILTLAVVAVLVAISLLALDRPDVSWRGADPLCPHCQSDVPFYGTRCPTCQQQFDWVVAPEARSPLSPWSLSTLEAERLRARTQALGEEEAARRVARALQVSQEEATQYLLSVGRGRCGWCGGTGVHMPATPKAEEPAPCPVCLGRKWCIACGGDRRMRLGDPGAGVAIETYAQGLGDIAPSLSQETQRAEVRRLNEAFLARHLGTVEATYLVHWPTWQNGSWPELDRPPHGWGTGAPATRAVEASRRRLDHVLVALDGG
jgi:hypothetical protein